MKTQGIDIKKMEIFDQRLAAKASFKVAWLIAQNKKPHTIREQLVKPVAVRMEEIMGGQRKAW